MKIIHFRPKPFLLELIEKEQTANPEINQTEAIHKIVFDLQTANKQLETDKRALTAALEDETVPSAGGEVSKEQKVLSAIEAQRELTFFKCLTLGFEVSFGECDRCFKQKKFSSCTRTKTVVRSYQK